MTPRIQDRRTFLRRAASLGSLSALGGLSGCVDGGNVDLGDVGDDGDDGGDPASVDLDLRAGVRIGTVFSGPGGQVSRTEVDPDEPGGGRLTTVESVDPGARVRMSWRETIEREIPVTATDDVGVGTPTPTPRVETVERTGTITASGLDDAHASFLPMFWKPGDRTTDTSGIWLSREAYRELRDTRETAWSPDVLTRISWVGREIQRRIRDAVEEVGEEEVTLEADGEFTDVELSVDGRPTTLRAIAAHDTFGNEYVVLADEANPLVARFTYDAVSVGATGFDTAIWTLIKAVFSGYRVVSVETP